MNNKAVQTIIGVLFGLLGLAVIGGAIATMVLAKSITLWGVVLVAIGALFVFWGGVLVPNSGVEDGAKKVSVFVVPFLPLFPGGRRATDAPVKRDPPCDDSAR